MKRKAGAISCSVAGLMGFLYPWLPSTRSFRSYLSGLPICLPSYRSTFRSLAAFVGK